MVHPKVLHIRSRDADKYYGLTSVFSMRLTEVIRCAPGYRIAVSCHNAQIPYTFYNVNSTNNVLNYTETDASGNTFNREVSLDYGNYSVVQFKTTLAQKMNVLNGDTIKYAFLFNAIQNKMVLQIDTTGCSCVLHSSSILSFLGFDGSYDISFGYGSPIISDIPIVMFSVNALYVMSNVVASSSCFSSRTKSSSAILCKIPVDQPPGTLISYFPHRVTKSVSSTSLIDEIWIALTDEDGNIIDLNGQHFELSIEIEFIKDDMYVKGLWNREAVQDVVEQDMMEDT